ncbi:hypothetical protein FJZ36_09370 [Candidatus Poribacteria bacterium]|nr:hypothetical protein [Candidatus Poribacteria bacterium]
MKGVHFIVDEKGKPRSVVIDLWGELWEDVYDTMLSESNETDSPLPWEEVKERLMRQAKSRAQLQPAS